ncbi:glycerate kinase [Endobacter medicaginis]|uniref:Glycerate kinase n=3 Tax=Endobacter medicaginis TaxID=1181271 RepID=A0A839UY13_9PROT|nr:glycerate kinase [Endobacter medicaginis]MBB3172221.1 glycerate kinase [Endobacter medicaginis]
MRIVIACDSFKGSLDARSVGEAITEGLRDVWPQDSGVAIRNLPIADGGEGTIDAIVDALGGTRRRTRVSGPLGGMVEAVWGFVPGPPGQPPLAVIEMAMAAGLTLLDEAVRDPRRASTRGVGEMMRAALDAGCRRFIVAIGGSATNDGGAGLAQALGVSLRDAHGVELPPGGAALAGLAEIDRRGLDPRLRDCVVEVACDVDNPLSGPDGASVVFGPQKGADAAAVAELDAALARYGALLDAHLGQAVSTAPGAGAAGGLGAGLMAFAGGVLRPGAGLVLDAVGLDAALAGADLVITGEGRLDAQSLRGKAPVAVARRAAARGIATIAIAGSLGEGAERAYGAGISAMFGIVEGPTTLAEAQRDAAMLVRRRAAAVARVWRAAVQREGSTASGSGGSAGMAR